MTAVCIVGEFGGPNLKGRNNIMIQQFAVSAQQYAETTTRVVSSEISGGKIPEIYSNLIGNFRKFVNYLCK